MKTLGLVVCALLGVNAIKRHHHHHGMNNFVQMRIQENAELLNEVNSKISEVEMLLQKKSEPACDAAC